MVLLGFFFILITISITIEALVEASFYLTQLGFVLLLANRCFPDSICDGQPGMSEILNG